MRIPVGLSLHLYDLIIVPEVLFCEWVYGRTERKFLLVIFPLLLASFFSEKINRSFWFVQRGRLTLFLLALQKIDIKVYQNNHISNVCGQAIEFIRATLGQVSVFLAKGYRTKTFRF